MTTSQAFLDALVSAQRAPELADVDDIFGFLIGSWDLEAVLHDIDGQTHRIRGEIHASWVLRGARSRTYSFFRVEQIDTPGAKLGVTDMLRQSEPMIGSWTSGELTSSILRLTKRAHN